jgi:hypothetical protein
MRRKYMRWIGEEAILRQRRMNLFLSASFYYYRYKIFKFFLDTYHK